MIVPPKPKRGKRSPFYWWRRWKSHKYLPVRAGLLARIQNGDFDYPDQFEWAEYEMHYMKDEHDAYRAEYKGFGDIELTEKWIMFFSFTFSTSYICFTSFTKFFC